MAKGVKVIVNAFKVIVLRVMVKAAIRAITANKTAKAKSNSTQIILTQTILTQTNSTLASQNVGNLGTGNLGTQ